VIPEIKPILPPLKNSTFFTTETTIVHPAILPSIIPVNSNTVEPEISNLPSTISPVNTLP
jgi:hypothetical protein